MEQIIELCNKIAMYSGGIGAFWLLLMVFILLAEDYSEAKWVNYLTGLWVIILLSLTCIFSASALLMGAFELYRYLFA